MTHQIRMKVYIAGPMTGLPDNNYPAFRAAARNLSLVQNFIVLDPSTNKGTHWIDYMRASLRMIADADCLYMLKGWEGSKGARLEHQLALDLHLPIFYEPVIYESQMGEAAAEPQPRLEDNEQYRCQMAGISTASLGYWKEGDSIHPDYDTVPLRNVAKLYAKYEALSVKYEALAKEKADHIRLHTKEVAPGVKEGWTQTEREAALAEQVVKAAYTNAPDPFGAPLPDPDHPSTGQDIPKVKSRYTVAVLDVFGRWVGVGKPSGDYGQIERDAVALSAFGLSVCVLPVAKPV